MATLHTKAFTFALTTFSLLAYALCAIFRPIFPGWPMYNATFWQMIFPGFSWTAGGVLIGLLWTVVYAGLSGLVFAGLYNFFAVRFSRVPARPEHTPTHLAHQSR